MRQRILLIAFVVIALTVAILMVNNDAGTTFGYSNEFFARLVWLTTLICVLGATVVMRGGLGGAGLVQIVVWLAIFVALVAGYKIYHNEPLFPGDTPPPRTSTDSGTGITASLMNSVDRSLHFVGPFDIS